MLSSKLVLGSANSKSIFNSLTIYINESFLPDHAPSVKPSLTVDDQLFKVNIPYISSMKVMSFIKMFQHEQND